MNVEAAGAKQHKHVRDILDRIEEFHKDPCEDVLRLAAAASSWGAGAPSVGDLDAYIAPRPKLHPANPKSPAKHAFWGSPKDKEPVLRALRNERTASEDGKNGDISYAAISRVSGGAALGTTIGTAFAPGLGTVAGAVLGGVVGALAPSILPRKKWRRRRTRGATTRPR